VVSDTVIRPVAVDATEGVNLGEAEINIGKEETSAVNLRCAGLGPGVSKL
jgi:hypothetical protein